MVQGSEMEEVRDIHMSGGKIDPGAFRGVRVLVTGHTGFKGAWLCAWLKASGAELSGLALAPESDRPNLFVDLHLEDQMRSTIGDIRDLELVRNCVADVRPEIIFHLAAQSLVRRSYADPVGTFATNALGTAHVLEAARDQDSVRAIVCVTSDKCYESRESIWGYRETDALGGNDPYSASKAAAEIVANSYRETLLSQIDRIRVATARGGNVVGGGDWSEDRLIPDLVRAALAGNSLALRNPQAIRPWQHVLELVRGYCILGMRLLSGDRSAEGAWNFGPTHANEVMVMEVVDLFVKSWSLRRCARLLICGSILPRPKRCLAGIRASISRKPLR
jgi:CDP-glucose 4,6-dehydratase